MYHEKSPIPEVVHGREMGPGESFVSKHRVLALCQASRSLVSPPLLEANEPLQVTMIQRFVECRLLYT